MIQGAFTVDIKISFSQFVSGVISGFYILCDNMLIHSASSEFQDIFDVEHFITSLRDEVRIRRELPPRIKQRVKLGKFHSMPPISWSDMSYYQKQVRDV